jgi:hypothetical protein
MKACTCQPGQEQHEEYYSALSKKTMVQYDFRSIDGKLFTTVAPTLEEARKKRDEWLKPE